MYIYYPIERVDQNIPDFSTFNFGFSLEDIFLEMSSVETYFSPMKTLF